MKRKSGKIRSLAVKVDLEKAYDKINWNFLEKVLVEVGFNDKLRQLILFCIKSSRLSIIWNGEKLSHFSLGRELRQRILYPPAYLCYAWKL